MKQTLLDDENVLVLNYCSRAIAEGRSNLDVCFLAAAAERVLRFHAMCEFDTMPQMGATVH